MAELKNRVSLREHYGHPVEERVLLPAAYVITLAFRKKDLPLEVVDLARFASSALGYKFPDPNPEVQR